LPRLDLAQNPRKTQNRRNAPRRLAIQPAPPGASSANPEIGINPKRRLAAGSVPPGGSFSRTQKQCRTDESPGGGSSPARRFLEISQKRSSSRF